MSDANFIREVAEYEGKLKMAKAQGDTEWEGELCHILGTLYASPEYVNQRQPTLAINYYRQGMTASSAGGYWHWYLRCANGLFGVYEILLHNQKAAIEVCEQTLREVPDMQPGSSEYRQKEWFEQMISWYRSS